MKKVLLGVPVRQDKDIFKAYLDSLDRLNIPEDVTLDRCFYLHDSRDLAHLLKDSDMVLFNDKQTKYETNGKTHEWNNGSLTEVAKMKNEMMRIALMGGYDYYFLVDSDLILHPNTLKHLIERDLPIVSEIFWTEWVEGSGEIMPNCWDQDMSSMDSIKRYRVPGIHETGGTGALILIKREVLEKGINYTPIYNISFSIWEDRAFAIRAAVHGYQLYIDTMLPARHLYRRNDYEKYIRKAGKNENKN